MILKRSLAAATALALVAGVAHAQTTPAPAAAPAPAAETAPAAPATPAAPAEAAAPAAAATPAPQQAATPAPAPAPAAVYTPITASGDIVDTLKAAGQFKILTKALDATNLTAVLKAHKGITLFAPTDAAFKALPAGELDRLMETDNAPELQGLLAYHLVNAPVDAAKMEGAKGPVTTVAKSELLLDGSGETLRANSAPIVQADVRTTSGLIHVVGAVLSPSDPIIAAAKAEAAQAAQAAAEADAEAAAAEAGTPAG